RKSTIAVATQRPGWRTGIALISADLLSSGLVRSRVSVVAIETSYDRRGLANRAVDGGVVDRPLLDVVLLQEGHVRPVRHQLLDRVEDRLRHPAVLPRCRPLCG